MDKKAAVLFNGNYRARKDDLNWKVLRNTDQTFSKVLY